MVTMGTNRSNGIDAGSKRPSFERRYHHEKGNRIQACAQRLIEQEFDERVGNVELLLDHNALIIPIRHMLT